MLDEIETRSRDQEGEATPPPTRADGPKLMGIASNDAADAMALRMLRHLLHPAGVRMEIIADASSPLEAADQIAEEAPALVLLSHLPPVGLTSARYLVRRIKARFPEAPLWAGRWCEAGNTEKVCARLTSMGADRVVLSLAEARTAILETFGIEVKTPAEEPLVESHS
jgi:hypothetical protein